MGLNQIINVHDPSEKTKQAFFTLIPRLLHHLLSNVVGMDDLSRPKGPASRDPTQSFSYNLKVDFIDYSHELPYFTIFYIKSQVYMCNV